jgi:hypothetical protein
MGHHLYSSLQLVAGLAIGRKRFFHQEYARGAECFMVFSANSTPFAVNLFISLMPSSSADHRQINIEHRSHDVEHDGGRLCA